MCKNSKIVSKCVWPRHEFPENECALGRMGATIYVTDLSTSRRRGLMQLFKMSFSFSWWFSVHFIHSSKPIMIPSMLVLEWGNAAESKLENRKKILSFLKKFRIIQEKNWAIRRKTRIFEKNYTTDIIFATIQGFSINRKFGVRKAFGPNCPGKSRFYCTSD